MKQTTPILKETKVIKNKEKETKTGEIKATKTKSAKATTPKKTKLTITKTVKPDNLEFLSENISSEIKNQFTEREIEILKYLVQGKSDTEIAKELIVSVHTVKAHVCSILQKLCVDDRVQAAVKAIRENLVS